VMRERLQIRAEAARGVVLKCPHLVGKPDEDDLRHVLSIGLLELPALAPPLNERCIPGDKLTPRSLPRRAFTQLGEQTHRRAIREVGGHGRRAHGLTDYGNPAPRDQETKPLLSGQLGIKSKKKRRAVRFSCRRLNEGYGGAVGQGGRSKKPPDVLTTNAA